VRVRLEALFAVVVLAAYYLVSYCKFVLLRGRTLKNVVECIFLVVILKGKDFFFGYQFNCLLQSVLCIPHLPAALKKIAKHVSHITVNN